MDIKNKKSILKYLNITLLSYSRYCYFVPGKDRNAQVRARLHTVSEERVQLTLTDTPERNEGFLIFHSYTYIFRFKCKLSADKETGVYNTAFPDTITTHDQRRYSRLLFESKENKIISVFNKEIGFTQKAILTDISAGGVGFICADPLNVPKVGDLVLPEISLPEINIKSFARVVQVRGEHVGCSFFDKSNDFQIDLNNTIVKEIAWRSETLHRTLKKREEMMHQVRATQLQQVERKEDIALNLEALTPVIEYFAAQMEAVTGILMEKDKVTFKENTVGTFAAAIYFTLAINQTQFKCFFHCHPTLIYKLSKVILKGKTDGEAVNANEILSTLGTQLSRQSTKPGQSELMGEISEVAVVEANKRMLSALLKHQSIEVDYKSEIGDFKLLLMADDLQASVNACANARKFITMEKMDLLQPLSFAAIDVFSNLLHLEIREKSVTTRDRLLPRFDITILLDVFFDDVEGKVVLNLSKKLALKMYEILVNERVEDFNDNVRDAVAEVTNMITGNAKSEFEKSGIFYKLSTPIVINSKDQAIVYVKNMKFLSSVYWTSEGFFELSFSFFKKEK